MANELGIAPDEIRDGNISELYLLEAYAVAARG